MADIEQKPILNIWAEDTSDYNEPSETEIADADGINPSESIDAEPVNGFARILFLAVQFLQRSGGLYGDTIPYISGQAVSLVRIVNSSYRISSFICRSATEITGEPPISDATVATTNGVDVYTGGTLNSTYWELNFPVVGDNWQDTLEDDLLDNMASALVNLIGLGANSFTAVSTDVYTTLTYTNATALFSTTASNTPDTSVGWIIQAVVVNGATRQFLAFSSSMGIRFGHSTDGTITWENIFSGLSLGTNWETTLEEDLNSNSADLLLTGIASSWLSIVTAAAANSITNSILAEMDAGTIKGAISSGSPVDLTGTEATTLLDVATESLKGLMSAADKIKLNLYPDEPGDNWNTAISTDLKSNMQSALANNIGFGLGVGSFSSVSTDVIETLLHAGDVALFAAGSTNNPDTSSTWQILCYYLGTSTVQGSKYIAFSSTTTRDIRYGVATSSTVITWDDVYTTSTVSNNWSDALTTNLLDNMLVAFSNTLGFGATSFTALTTGVYATLLHTGDIALFSSSATGIPDSSYSWIIHLVIMNNTTKFFTAYSSSAGLRFGFGTTSAITWVNIFSELSVGDGQTTLLSDDYYVINSDETFQTLCDATSGSYPKVKVLEGTWTTTTALDLTTTGIKYIEGVGDAVLNFETSSGSYLFTGSGSEEIENISITESSSVSTLSVFYLFKKIENISLTLNTVNGIRYGFVNCTNLSSINIEPGGGDATYDLYLFTGCKRISDIYINSDIDILTNNLFLFYNSLNINNITINFTAGFDSLYCFFNSDNVEGVDIDLTSVSGSIAYITYNSCENLSKLKCTFTGPGKFVGFSYALNLSDVTLDINSTYSTSEEIQIFTYCDNISNIRFIDFDVDYTHVDVFFQCDNISNIHIESFDISNEAQIFKNCRNIKNIWSEADIAGTTVYFFYNCYDVSNVYINNTVTSSIGFYIFIQCSGISCFHCETTQTSGIIEGFNNTNRISNGYLNLSGIGAATETLIYGFVYSDQISDCTLVVTDSSGTTTYCRGFFSCDIIRGCKVTMSSDTLYAFASCKGLMGNYLAVGIGYGVYSSMSGTIGIDNTGDGGLNYTA